MPIDLCQTCQRAMRVIHQEPPTILGTKFDFTSVELHKDFSSFRDSIQAHCVFCNYAWQHLLSEADEGTRRAVEAEAFAGAEVSLRLDLTYYKRDGKMSVWFKFPHPGGEFQDRLKAMANTEFLQLVVHELADCETMPPPVDHTAGSRLKQIQKWIKTCKREHPECRHTPCEGWLPSRLIDLEKPGAPRIIASAQAVPNSPYATLSHCWGGYQPLRLLRKNDPLEISATGELIAHLPKTYADTVTICKSLNIRFLWIDSLCIIQDSVEDWASEAQKMDKVYENAFINFSALSARNSTEGLFLEKTLVNEPPWTLHLDNNDDAGAADEAGGSGSLYYIDVDFRASAVSQEFNRKPLSQRAWVMQERLLSQRIVSFGKRYLYWECARKRMYNSSFGLSLDHDLPTRDNLKKAWRVVLAKLAAQPGDNTTGDFGSDEQSCIPHLSRFWFDMVWDYARRNLTVPSDKLVAIQGVVNRLQALLPGNRYLFGLWESELPLQLLWHNKYMPVALKKAESWRAPSWSWAAYDGRVNFPEVFRCWSRMSFSAEVEGSSICEHNHEGDPEVTKPFIRLRGHIIANQDLFMLCQEQDTDKWLSFFFDKEHDEELVYENSKEDNFQDLILVSGDNGKIFQAWGLILKRLDGNLENEQFVRKGLFGIRTPNERLGEWVEGLEKRSIVIV